jgi:hypothetical protein
LVCALGLDQLPQPITPTSIIFNIDLPEPAQLE